MSNEVIQVNISFVLIPSKDKINVAQNEQFIEELSELISNASCLRKTSITYPIINHETIEGIDLATLMSLKSKVKNDTP